MNHIRLMGNLFYGIFLEVVMMDIIAVEMEYYARENRMRTRNWKDYG